MVLPVLPVLAPLMIAAFLAGMTRLIRPALAFWFALATTIGVAVSSSFLFLSSWNDPLVYWFGGWEPRGGIALGISFVVEPLGAGMSALVSVLVAAAFVFSSKYFDTVRTHYHVLMLVFLGAMCGFSLTGDLFNLFVFFELMSVSAFVLCGYKSEEPGPLQGALNFAITNSIAAVLVVSGIALLYGQTGALNLAQIGRTLGQHVDGLVITAFVFLVTGFAIKAAIVPFHFWLADAHAVAPTPVCILFSGVMVELGLLGITRVYWTIFSGPFASHTAALRGILLGAGVITAVVGAVMCFAQRHIKRLLAFSTVSHIGLMGIGFGLLDRGALAGMAIYIAGHAMVKASLFLCAGIILHRFGSIDEIELRGRGRITPWTAGIFILNGIGLSGLPPWGTFLGGALIKESAMILGYGWLYFVDFFTTVLTGAAVFRVAGRVFAGWGPAETEFPKGSKKIEEKSETTKGHEKIPAVMYVPALILSLLGLLIGVYPGLLSAVDAIAGRIEDHLGYAARVLEGVMLPMPSPEMHEIKMSELTMSIGSTLCAILLALTTLFRKPIAKKALKLNLKGLQAGVGGLRQLHSGIISDYVAWLTIGLAAFGALSAYFLRP